MRLPGQRALLIVALALLGAGVLLGTVTAVGEAATGTVATQPKPGEPGFGSGRWLPDHRHPLPGWRPFGRVTPSPAPGIGPSPSPSPSA